MYELRVGDGRTLLDQFSSNHFHSVVTSPPYFRLRNYGHAAQVGWENAPAAYVERLVELFREIRRVLRPDGSLWLNIADTYASGPLPGGVKKKDCIGIPWMLAFALRADGWHLRSECIWTKPNGTPESVQDRPSRCHEHVFLLTKTARYFYDKEAVREPASSPKPTGKKAAALAVKGNNGGAWAASKDVRGGFVTWNPRGRSKRSVWTISTSSFRAHRVGITDVTHFALFPPALVRPCILAGTSAAGCCSVCGAPWRRHLGQDPHDPAQDTWRSGCPCAAAVVPCRVLDPFAGSCTTGVVCIEEGRDFTGFELNPDYARLGHARLDDAKRKKEANHAS